MAAIQVVKSCLPQVLLRGAKGSRLLPNSLHHATGATAVRALHDFSGIYPPIPTPFNADESIAYDKLEFNISKWNAIPFRGKLSFELGLKKKSVLFCAISPSEHKANYMKQDKWEKNLTLCDRLLVLSLSLSLPPPLSLSPPHTQSTGLLEKISFK